MSATLKPQFVASQCAEKTMQVKGTKASAKEMRFLVREESG